MADYQFRIEPVSPSSQISNMANPKPAFNESDGKFNWLMIVIFSKSWWSFLVFVNNFLKSFLLVVVVDLSCQETQILEAISEERNVDPVDNHAFNG